MNHTVRIAASMVATALLSASASAYAQVPPILLEACNQMEPAAKRLECLQAANQQRTSASKPSTTPGNSAAAAPPVSSLYTAPAGTPRTTSSGQTCHVGPRGGTYTITGNGRKNYGGC